MDQASEDQAYVEARQESLDKILGSGARKRVIVAGPGCGKTFTFKQLLRKAPGEYLVLTFINNLVSDLKEELGDLATVRTFHGFSKHLLHTLPVTGITNNVDYFPKFQEVVLEDIFQVDGLHLLPRNLEAALHNLSNEDGYLDLIVRSGDYYNAVGHTDSVYRVHKSLSSGASPPKFDLIVVDEYQDFSLLEVELIHALAHVNPIVVAGDDDQALYFFKHASAQYLRDLVKEPEWETLSLPFCSRCPEVVVQATHRIVEKASQIGLLHDRIDKKFVCFLPEKRQVSEQYPKVIHAKCTVQRPNAPYMAKYIEACISAIPTEDLEVSKKARNPTVLVCGPNPFSGQIYSYLAQKLPNVVMKQAEQEPIGMLDAYRRLLRDPCSRLGWRIAIGIEDPGDTTEILKRCLLNSEEISEVLPDEYRTRHLRHVETLRKLVAGDSVDETDLAELQAEVGMVSEVIRAEMGVEETEEPPEGPGPLETEVEDAPSVLVTRVLGSKGLQAEHVFVVGLSRGHFPRAWPPTDTDVCSFLVALTRAKQSCALVTCDRLGQQVLPVSPFVSWLGDLVDTQIVNADFFR